MKLVKQEEARNLRKEGYSIKEISTILGVAKSSVSLWVRNVRLSSTARKIIEAKFTNGRLRAKQAIEQRTANRLRSAEEFARETLKSFPKNKMTYRVCCALLYSCEGTRSLNDKDFRFTNSDPRLMSAFLTLLRASFTIDESKFRACVHLHDYHDEKTQLQFWSKTTSIPLSQFIKSYKKSHTGKQRREGYPGCIQVSYNDVSLARQIQAVAREFFKHGLIG